MVALGSAREAVAVAGSATVRASARSDSAATAGAAPLAARAEPGPSVLRLGGPRNSTPTSWIAGSTYTVGGRLKYCVGGLPGPGADLAQGDAQNLPVVELAGGGLAPQIRILRALAQIRPLRALQHRRAEQGRPAGEGAPVHGGRQPQPAVFGIDRDGLDGVPRAPEGHPVELDHHLFVRPVEAADQPRAVQRAVFDLDHDRAGLVGADIDPQQAVIDPIHRQIRQRVVAGRRRIVPFRLGRFQCGVHGLVEAAPRRQHLGHALRLGLHHALAFLLLSFFLLPALPLPQRRLAGPGRRRWERVVGVQGVQRRDGRARARFPFGLGAVSGFGVGVGVSDVGNHRVAGERGRGGGRAGHFRAGPR